MHLVDTVALPQRLEHLTAQHARSAPQEGGAASARPLASRPAATSRQSVGTCDGRKLRDLVIITGVGMHSKAGQGRSLRDIALAVLQAKGLSARQVRTLPGLILRWSETQWWMRLRLEMLSVCAGHVPVIRHLGPNTVPCRTAAMLGVWLSTAPACRASWRCRGMRRPGVGCSTLPACDLSCCASASPALGQQFTWFPTYCHIRLLFRQPTCPKTREPERRLFTWLSVDCGSITERALTYVERNRNT